MKLHPLAGLTLLLGLAGCATTQSPSSNSEAPQDAPPPVVFAHPNPPRRSILPSDELKPLIAADQGRTWLTPRGVQSTGTWTIGRCDTRSTM